MKSNRIIKDISKLSTGLVVQYLDTFILRNRRICSLPLFLRLLRTSPKSAVKMR